MCNPHDDCPSDEQCAYCHSTLRFVLEKREPQESEWEFRGFCDAECVIRFYLAYRIKFPDDSIHGSSRKELSRALNEVLEKLQPF